MREKRHIKLSCDDSLKAKLENIELTEFLIDMDKEMKGRFQPIFNI